MQEALYKFFVKHLKLIIKKHILKNNYDLHGAGITFSIPVFSNFALTATYAKKIGNNPGKDVDGKDVDGLTWGDRSLISLVGQF